MGIQDFSQLLKDYGSEQADVIINITGNIISGLATGDTAKQLSERFVKILQTEKAYILPLAGLNNWNLWFHPLKFRH